MRIVPIQLQKIEINSFLASQNQIECAVHLHDGSSSQILLKKLQIHDVEQSTEQLLSYVKDTIHKVHEEQIQESVADTSVTIALSGEDFTRKELPTTLQKAKQLLDQVSSKKDADGYLDLVRNIKNLKVEIK